MTGGVGALSRGVAVSQALGRVVAKTCVARRRRDVGVGAHNLRCQVVGTKIRRSRDGRGVEERRRNHDVQQCSIVVRQVGVLNRRSHGP